MKIYIANYQKGTRSVINNCLYCGISFKSFISEKAKFCSQKCAHASGINRLGKRHTEKTKRIIREKTLNNSKIMATTFKKGHTLWDNPKSREHWIKKGTIPKNYAGGYRTKWEIIKDSKEYRDWRKAVFSRDNYTCQGCGQYGGTLQADHIKPKAQFPELMFEIDNGRTLCVPCHKLTPTWGRGRI